MELKQNKLAHINSTLIVTKAKDLPSGQFEAVLSTDDLDRHGEIVSIKGLAIPTNQVIKMYYNHETTGANLPIGQWTKIWKNKDGKLMGRGQIDLLDDFEVKIDKKIKLGTLDSISIGFYPQEFDGESSTWTKSLLVEASVVAEPANTNAKVTQKELGFTKADFNKALQAKIEEVEKNDETDEPSSTDGAIDTEFKAAFELLKSKVGAVEETLKASAEIPATKELIRLRITAKKVGQAAEELNQILRIKLKGTK